MEASLSPKQETLSIMALAKSGAAGCVMLTIAVVIQLTLSVTVSVYVPEGILKISYAFTPFDQANE